MANQHIKNYNPHWVYILLVLLLYPNILVIACSKDDTPLFQEQRALVCAIIVNEKQTTDTLVFQLETDMMVGLLQKSENIRKMSTNEIWKSLDNMEPFVIDENTFLEIKAHDWAVRPSAYLDSIYNADSILGVLTECFFPVDGGLYMKCELNKDEAPIIWTDYHWAKHPGDHDFYAEISYVVYLLQKHHIYTEYDNFLNIRLLSNINIAIDPIIFERRE